MKIETITVGPIEENCSIIFCEEHRSAIIVDPGDSGRRIAGQIEKKSLVPKLIIATHCHSDHTGGIGALKERFNIPFLCHEEDVWMLTDRDQLATAEYLGIKPPPPNDATLSDGDTVDLCEDFAFRVIHTPGHSPGGICLYGEGALLSGDTLFENSIGRSDLPGGNHNQLMKSIKEKLLVLPDETVVYPGHGGNTTIEREKKNNPFLRQLEGFA